VKLNDSSGAHPSLLVFSASGNSSLHSTGTAGPIDFSGAPALTAIILSSTNSVEFVLDIHQSLSTVELQSCGYDHCQQAEILDAVQTATNANGGTMDTQSNGPYNNCSSPDPLPAAITSFNTWANSKGWTFNY
jgi:hypothetical protein